MHARTCPQVGTLTLTTLGGKKVAGLELDGVEERVYRLHFNARQNRADRFANTGGVFGAAAAAALEGASPRPVLGGFAAGTAAGVALHYFTGKRKA